MEFSHPYSTLFLFFYVFVINICQARIVIPDNVTIPALLAFGDSIVDQGNNNHLNNTVIKCNFVPYGKDVLSGKPSGRFCNGRTPADILAEELGIKEFVPAYLDPHLQPNQLTTGVSFASGGTGYDPQTPQLASVFSLEDELNMFKEYIGRLEVLVGDKRTNFIIENSIYLVVAGNDDLANNYFTIGLRRLQCDINSYTDFLVEKATEFVKDLHKMGAKRVAVFGDPPIGCLPSQRTVAGVLYRACNEQYNQAAQMYNSKLNASLEALNRSLHDPKARLVYVDIYSPLLYLIRNYKEYGLTVSDRGCCGTGALEVAIFCNSSTSVCADADSYLFWDSYHPTEEGYRLLLDRILGTGILNSFF